MRRLQNRIIYRDDFELLHEGAQRMGKALDWKIIERPSEPTEADSTVLTLEELGLQRFRPVVAEVVAEETIICESCVNRHNAPGSGPCGTCDLTEDGEASNYCAEADAPLENEDDDEDDDDEDDDDEDDAVDVDDSEQGPQTLGRT